MMEEQRSSIDWREITWTAMLTVSTLSASIGAFILTNFWVVLASLIVHYLCLPLAYFALGYIPYKEELYKILDGCKEKFSYTPHLILLLAVLLSGAPLFLFIGIAIPLSQLDVMWYTLTIFTIFILYSLLLCLYAIPRLCGYSEYRQIH